MSASRVLLVGLTVLSGATLALALVVGSVDLGMAGVWAVLQGGGDALQRNVILALRLPRALSAFAVGGLLALAGALMQVLLRNPLADPYILGVSGGGPVGWAGAPARGGRPPRPLPPLPAGLAAAPAVPPRRAFRAPAALNVA